MKILNNHRGLIVLGTLLLALLLQACSKPSQEKSPR